MKTILIALISTAFINFR